MLTLLTRNFTPIYATARNNVSKALPEDRLVLSYQPCWVRSDALISPGSEVKLCIVAPSFPSGVEVIIPCAIAILDSVSYSAGRLHFNLSVTKAHIQGIHMAWDEQHFVIDTPAEHF